MAKKQVIDAVETRLGEAWNGLPVFSANTVGDPPSDGTPFWMVQYPVASASRMPINSPTYREEGGFRIVLHEERGIGLDRGMSRCETISDLFRDQSFSGVSCKVPSSPFIDDDIENGNYIKLSIVVPYTFNF